MADKTNADKADADVKVPAPKPEEPKSPPASPLATDKMPVYRADMGESLPPQKKPGVE